MAISFQVEQLTPAQSFLDRAQQMAAAAAYGTAQTYPSGRDGSRVP
jgi:hypothetical protein